MLTRSRHSLLRASALPLLIGLGFAGGLTGGVAQALAACGASMRKSANPCAAKKNPCNPCAAKKKANPCNPCAAKKKANPCNPCAAKKKANPCNPCAAKKKASPCNPCAAKKKANPCNPCAAKKKANPCNPCAAKKKANPCNPCSAGKAGGRQGRALNPQAAQKLFLALLPTLKQTYRGGAHPVADGRWAGWKNFARAPYIGATHGSRYLVNFANPTAAKVYGQYEKLRVMPVGGIIAKPSFIVDGKSGKAQPGPLFIMEKMRKGFNAATRDWRYAMIMPGGETYGITNGPGSAKVAFCADCHNGAAETDALMFLPEKVRVN